jgi:hypothetical protein
MNSSIVKHLAQHADRALELGHWRVFGHRDRERGAAHAADGPRD